MIPPSSWLKLSQKTAIVSGAASGIGAAVSSALVKEHGCRQVILVDRHDDKLQDIILKQDNTRHASFFTPISCDVGDENQVRNMMQVAFGNSSNFEASPSILINCAGITRDSLVANMSIEQWNEVLNVNLTGTFLMCREFIRCRHDLDVLNDKPIMNATSRSSIVNVGSVVAKYGNVGQANYAASKGGVVGLTRALAKESATAGIRVNAVLPGFVDTPMVQAVPEKVKAHIRPKIALQRLGSPYEVANLILFLASCETSGYITGECIECSGSIAL